MRRRPSGHEFEFKGDAFELKVTRNENLYLSEGKHVVSELAELMAGLDSGRFGQVRALTSGGLFTVFAGPFEPIMIG